MTAAEHFDRAEKLARRADTIIDKVTTPADEARLHAIVAVANLHLKIADLRTR